MDSFNYQVIDNFLSPHDHKRIEDLLTGVEFPWYLNDYNYSDNELIPADSVYNFQFTHGFYSLHRITSEFYNHVVYPFLIKIKPLAFIRIKANLNPVTSDTIKYGWHVDYENYKHKTAVYYVNTNNGKTIFKNGLEVESIANRLVVFDGNMKHTATSCTDKKTRCVINFNYVEEGI